MSGVVAPIAGRLADRYGPRWLMPIGLIIAAIAFFSIAGTQAIWQFFAAYILGRAVSNPVLVGGVPRTAAVNFFFRRRNMTLALISTFRPISGAINIPHNFCHFLCSLVQRIQVLAIDIDLIPEVFALHQNYPNPFNPTTQIRYDLPEDAMVTITIYDIMGRSIRSLVNSKQTAGYRSIQWNATNNAGSPVSAGLYLYTIQAGDFRQAKKMVLLK